MLTALVGSLVVSLPAASTPAAAAETPVPGTRWAGFMPYSEHNGSNARAAALAPDGSVMIATDTNSSGFGVAKLDVPSGVPRADFGRNGYADISEYLPSGRPIDIAPRPDGGAYLLLGGAEELRLWDGIPKARTVGVVALTADGKPDPAFGSLPNLGNVGTRYWPAGQGGTITDVVGIAAVPGDKAVVAYTEQHPGQVTEVNPDPRPQTDVLLRRIGADGQLDSTYGNGGTARWVFPDQLVPGSYHSVELQQIRATADGAVLALVETQWWATADALPRKRLNVLRFTPDGDLDTTFGTDGVVEVADARPDCSTRPNGALRAPLSIGPDGSFVVASARPRDGDGYCDGGEDYDAPTELLVNVFNADGTPDTTFSSDGRLRYHLSQPDPAYPAGERRPWNQPASVLLDRLGRVVVQDRGDSQSGALVRFDGRGALDTTFGSAAGLFNAPSGYEASDMLETASGDYLLPGAPQEPFSQRSARASLYLADTDVPVPPVAPEPSDDERPALVPRTDRPWRPGDTVQVDLGSWTGPAVDRFEVSLLGCEPRHDWGRMCYDQPLGREEASAGADSVTFTLPVGAAGQWIGASVVAVTADGVRGTTSTSREKVGPSRHLITWEQTAGLPGILDGSVPRSAVFTLPDGTTGAVFSTGYSWKLKVAERAPDGTLEEVMSDELTNVIPLQVVSAADGWVHAVLRSNGNLYAIDRDPATAAWSAPVKLSNVAQNTQLVLSANPLAVADDGRAVIAWAEPSKQAGAEDSAPPVAVRVRTPQGWSPVRYVDEPATYTCPDGSKSCYPEPTSHGGMGVASQPVASITDTGVVNVVWTRPAVVWWNNHEVEGAFGVRLAADGTPGSVELLTPWSGRRVQPLSMTTLADGSSLLLVKELTADHQGFDLLMQQVPADAAVQGSSGDGFPGQLLRSYRRTDTLWTNTWGDPRHNQAMVMGVDGNHWRLVFTEDVARPGPGYSQVVHLSGVGSEVNPVQVLDRRPETDWGGGELILEVGPSGKAFLVTDSEIGDNDRPEYSIADGNGPMSTLEPLATEYTDAYLHLSLMDAPLTTSGPVANRSYSPRFVDGAWHMASLDRQDGLTTYRLAGGKAGPRVAIEDPSAPRPNKAFTVQVDPARSFDPDGGTLSYAWDLDQDGAFDDATGAQASVMGGSAEEEMTVSVRATSTDGDRAHATLSVWPWENEPPSVWDILGPDTVEAGTPVDYSAEAWDNSDGDQLSYAWFVNGTAQAGQTGDTATLTLPAGQVKVKVRVTDLEGASAAFERTVTATSSTGGNKAPTVTLTPPTKTTAGNPATFTASATDDGGVDALSYLWKVDGVIQPASTPGQLTATLRKGTHDVSVTVTDVGGKAASATRSVKVTIATGKLPAEPVEVLSATKQVVNAKVTVPGKGAVSVVLRKVGGTKVFAKKSAKTLGPSDPKLVLSLTRAGVRLLSKPGSYQMEAVTTFTPTGRKAQVRTQVVTVSR